MPEWYNTIFIQTCDISERKAKACYKNIRGSIILINIYIPKMYTKKLLKYLSYL